LSRAGETSTAGTAAGTAGERGPAAGRLLARIQAREAVVGVIGQGYVGLPLALLFSERGFPVIGFDVDAQKIESLARGESYIRHIGPERVAQARERGNFAPTTDFSRLASCDVVVICVPTPLGRHREPDMTYVHGTAREVARHLRGGQLVVLESTTYPGTTDEEVLPLLVASGLHTPADFFLAFSPEREDPGNQSFSTESIPKVVGGVNEVSTELAVAFYGQAITTVVPVSSSRVAEAAKLLENIYRSVNIALVNELKVIFDRMGIDVWEVIEAAKTKPFGYQAFYPGPGLGGHCIPLDPFYLTWKAAEYGHWTRFIELAGEVNSGMPRWVVGKVQEALSTEGKCLRGASILLLGLSYKPDIDDDRESPSYELIALLEEQGAQVGYCDPYFPVARPGRKHDISQASVPLSAAEFGRYDCLLLSTAHREFYDPDLYREVSLLVDTRNVVRANGATRIVRA